MSNKNQLMPSTVMSREKRKRIAEQQKARQKERDKIALERKEAAQFGASMSPTSTAYQKSKAKAIEEGRTFNIGTAAKKADKARVIAAGQAVKAKQNKKSDDAKAARTRAATSGKKKTPSKANSMAAAAKTKRDIISKITAAEKKQGAKKSAPAKNFNVGVSKGGVSFGEAFKHFRSKGQSTFTWNGKKYTTEVAKAKPKAKVGTPTPADFSTSAKKAAPKKAAPKKTASKSKDPRGNQIKATPGKAKSALPAGAKPFKGSYNSKTHKLQKINGKMYTVPKGK